MKPFHYGMASKVVHYLRKIAIFKVCSCLLVTYNSTKLLFLCM